MTIAKDTNKIINCFLFSFANMLFIWSIVIVYAKQLFPFG
jgi:hypothetical protein